MGISNKNVFYGTLIAFTLLIKLNVEAIHNQKAVGFHYNSESSPISQYPSFFQYNNIKGNDTVICQIAQCTYKEHTKFNIVEPSCGFHSVCQECPYSPVNSDSICHLHEPTPGFGNVVEGFVRTTNKQITSETQEITENNTEDGGKKAAPESNKALVEIYDFEFVPNGKPSDIRAKSRMCIVNPDNTVDISITFLMQWSKIPGKEKVVAPFKMKLDESDEDEISFIQDVNDDEVSFAQMKGVGLKGRLKSLLSRKSKMSEEEIDDYVSEGKQSIKEGVGFFNKTKEVVGKLKRRFHKPKLHINFVTTHSDIIKCRQPSRWSGELSGKALLFIAQQNIKIRPGDIKADFFKNAVRVNVTCKDCEVLGYSSCVQVQCQRSVSQTLNVMYHN
ncbi:hypothetical protein BdWA1_002349 [Babesia duncani]|uniref:Uncharacterized protein n=1 Tax=Babesia duncani TaxID=323732 RepID=A0AAD9PJ02_9APIC|nr:hypothetical protein BdWA1_002349 [Babesia duncani]